jgi:hypothetical protein
MRIEVEDRFFVKLLSLLRSWRVYNWHFMGLAPACAPCFMLSLLRSFYNRRLPRVRRTGLPRVRLTGLRTCSVTIGRGCSSFRTDNFPSDPVTDHQPTMR